MIKCNLVDRKGGMFVLILILIVRNVVLKIRYIIVNDVEIMLVFFLFVFY